MKAIIIGVPGRGKTTLAKRIRDNFSDARIISLSHLRNALGVHEPHKGYETEVADVNIPFFVDVVDAAMSYLESYIVEGYGLSPEDAIKLSFKHNCPVVLLCHWDTASAEEDFKLARVYDADDKWTRKCSNEYLRELFCFYKGVEKEWVYRMPEYASFSTDSNFESSINHAYRYIVNRQANTHCKTDELCGVASSLDKSSDELRHERRMSL